MKVLVLSNTPWDINNSFGNSFSNIFSGITSIEFANICCRYGELNNEFNMKGFQITEKSLISNLKNSANPSGKEITTSLKNKNCISERGDTEAITGFEQARKMRWQVMFWARDIIWKLGKWKSKELLSFIDDFQPDLIFQPVYYSNYICEIALFIKEYTKAPMVGYISDDNYSLRQFELSPLYWIDRLIKRKKVKAVIESCELLYVISQIQKNEYERIFTPPCKILTKCADFSDTPFVFNVKKTSKIIKLIYAGNLGLERWKSLAMIAKSVEEINQKRIICELDIFSATPLTTRMKRALLKKGCSLRGSVPYNVIQEKLSDADIVIHVEGLSIKSRMAVHQSFSTKLVDYFSIGKCILAVGTEDEASIKHLLDNDAGVVCRSQKEIRNRLNELVDNPDLIIDYGKKAYSCGAQNHNRKRMQEMVLSDFNKLLR